MAAGHVSENALYARVAEEQPRSQGPLSSFLENVRERTLGTRLAEEMYSQILPTYKLEHIKYLYLTMKSGYYLVSKINNL